MAFSGAERRIQPLKDSSPSTQGEAFFAAVVDPPDVPIKWTFNDSEIRANNRISMGRDGGFCTMKVHLYSDLLIPNEIFFFF